MQQQLKGKMEKCVTPSVEELATSMATFQINEENNERIEETPDLSNTWQRNLAASDSSTTHEIVLETQDLGQISQGTSQKMVVSTELTRNRSTIYFV
ncbi:hypothetical protein AMTRI_Chr04g183340 [Amborella trichopoda]